MVKKIVPMIPAVEKYRDWCIDGNIDEAYLDTLTRRIEKSKAILKSSKVNVVDEIVKAAAKIKTAGVYGSDMDKLSSAVEDIGKKIREWGKTLPGGYDISITILDTCYSEDIKSAASQLQCSLATKLTYKDGKLTISGIKPNTSYYEMHCCSFLLSLPGIFWAMEEMEKGSKVYVNPKILIMKSLGSIVEGLTTFKCV